MAEYKLADALDTLDSARGRILQYAQQEEEKIKKLETENFRLKTCLLEIFEICVNSGLSGNQTCVSLLNRKDAIQALLNISDEEEEKIKKRINPPLEAEDEG